MFWRQNVKILWNINEIKKIKSYLIKKRKSSFVFFNLTITKFLFWLLRHFIPLYKNEIYDVFFSGCYCFLSTIVIIISHKHNESCLWLSINYWFGLSGSCYTISNKKHGNTKKCCLNLKYYTQMLSNSFSISEQLYRCIWFSKFLPFISK